MEDVIRQVTKLKKSSITEKVDMRMEEFRSLGRKDKSELFKELCFCMLTANYSAEGGIRIQSAIGDGFLKMEKEVLAGKLVELGHRFPEARAGYIVEARKHIDHLENLMKMPGKEARIWLAENVKGLGLKESSHFLRNVGFGDVAIVDFHIVDLLVREGLMERPKTLTPKKYLEAETILEGLARKLGMDLGELDLYLWYIETGKVLK